MSAWRGPWATGITPSRMKSCLLVEAAISSIAQHASPKFMTQRLYFLPQFRTNLAGCGKLTLSVRPTRSLRLLQPLENLLLPRVQESYGQDDNEDDHLGNSDPRASELLEDGREGEQEHAFDIEDDEKEGKDVIADLSLAPPFADGIDAALVGRVLLGTRFART